MSENPGLEGAGELSWPPIQLRDYAVHSVGVFEAKNRLTALLNEVEKGGEVLITRWGKPVARLVSAEPGFDHAKARRAAEGLRATSKGQSLNGLSIRELITEGER